MQIWNCFDSEMIAVASPLVSAGRSMSYGFQPSPPPKDRPLIAEFFIEGVMTRWGLTESRYGSRGTATKPLREQMDRVADNPAFSAAVIHINSPGGTTDGTRELYDSIARLAAVKPVVAAIDGLCCSAALYAASAATHVTATPGSQIGSLGVFAVVVDSSRLHADLGLKVHVVRTSAIKGTGIPGEEVTPEQLAYLQRMVADSYRDFREAVQAGRKLTTDRLEMVATAEVWRAKRAQQLGLVDSVGYLRETLPGAGFPTGNLYQTVALTPTPLAASPGPKQVQFVPVGGGTSINVQA